MGAAAMIHSERDEAAAFHESSAKVNYPDLDTAKLLMAFLVVEIHTRPLEALVIPERIIEGIDVVAVPFFFIASAFLCFRGLSEADFQILHLAPQLGFARPPLNFLSFISSGRYFIYL